MNNEHPSLSRRMECGETVWALENVKPGMRFQEFLSVWYHVVAVGPNIVTVERYNGGDEIPSDADLIHFISLVDFIKYFSYSNADRGTWVRYVDDNAPIKHHADRPSIDFNEVEVEVSRSDFCRIVRTVEPRGRDEHREKR